jgi:hypothetical protein
MGEKFFSGIVVVWQGKRELGRKTIAQYINRYITITTILSDPIIDPHISGRRGSIGRLIVNAPEPVYIIRVVWVVYEITGHFHIFFPSVFANTVTKSGESG